MDFKMLSCVATAVFGALCLILMVLPELIYWMFALEQAQVGDVLAKRAAMLFLGFATLCFMARDTMLDEVKQLVSVTVITAMVAMALLGTYEFWQGTVGAGIWIAILAEWGIAGLFFRGRPRGEAASK
ncbi:hypothetical protein HKX54_12665 [Sulfitobacter sp. M57]|nr:MULTISPECIES: hypothetical protein [unclassified Sulfitobacter]MDF3478846.1 hypothetical protein [Sulfitobacter sp. M53]MDF3482744.1 hypothetical protein [Sulfitobacter sp. M24]MDF3486641.1 hypothetical protein [Sulfitobacter sp. Ks13]MDF3415314.1 hypothetical protein [Sulfitobacter sp. KE5]MDF3433860.1 hypothetical protein [Sulfitobacter sp. KE42]